MFINRVSFNNAVFIGIFFILSYMAFLLFFRDEQLITSSVSYVLIPIVTSITLLILVYACIRSKNYGKDYYRAWIFLMLSQFFWVLGDISWAILYNYPKLIDIDIVFVLYALRTFFLILALILIPRPRIDFLPRLKNYLEFGMVIVTLFMVFWSFLIYPFITINPVQSDNVWLLIGFTFLEFFLVFSIISLIYHYVGHLRKSPVFFIAIGTTFQIIAASIFVYETLLNQYPGGGLEDLFWVMASVSIALAGLLHINKSPPKVLKNHAQKSKIFKSTSNVMSSITGIIASIIVFWSFYNDKSIFIIVIIGGGTLVGLSILSSTVTNRIINQSYEKMERSENALKKSEKKYRNIIENANEGIMSTNSDGEIVFSNPRIIEMLGYKENELIGKKIFSLMDTESIQIGNSCFINVKNGKKAQNEFKFLRKDGSIIQVLINVSPIINNNKYKGCLALVSDITARKQAEENINRSKKSLSKILNAVSFGVIIVDKNKRIIKANKTALNLGGYDLECDLIGKPCHDSLCPADKDKCPIFDMGKNIDKSERILIKKDGTKIPIMKSAIMINLNGEEVLLESFIDISEKKELIILLNSLCTKKSYFSKRSTTGSKITWKSLSAS